VARGRELTNRHRTRPGPGPYEIAQRYALGEISRETMLSALTGSPVPTLPPPGVATPAYCPRLTEHKWRPPESAELRTLGKEARSRVTGPNSTVSATRLLLQQNSASARSWHVR